VFQRPAFVTMSALMVLGVLFLAHRRWRKRASPTPKS
jgi:hypothetical protein